MSVVIIMGSEVDRPHVEIMVKKLESYNTKVDTYVASAHKTPKVVLEVLEKYIRGNAYSNPYKNPYRQSPHKFL